MTSKPILLLGGSGYIGSAYQVFFKEHGISYVSLGRAELDYTNREALLAYLKANKFGFLINAAGYTGKPNVDACEVHKAECLAGNAVLPGIIQEACEARGLAWGHISSGCIYSGSRADGSGFRETDLPNFSFRSNNCSFYSGTKALGEEVLAGANNCYVWRLRIPFDHYNNSRNYLTKVMQYERLLDVRNSFSHIGDFIQATYQSLVERFPFGVYNVTNPGSLTTREVVDLIKRSMVCDKQFQFFDNEKEFMDKAAKTPRSSCVLDSTKIMEAGARLRPIEQCMEQTLQEWTV